MSFRKISKWLKIATMGEPDKDREQILIDKQEKIVQEQFVKKYDNQKTEKRAKKFWNISKGAFKGAIPALLVGTILCTLAVAPVITTIAFTIGGIMTAGTVASALVSASNMKKMQSAEAAKYYMENKNDINYFVNTTKGRKLILERGRNPYKRLKKAVSFNEKIEEKVNVSDIINNSVSVAELKRAKKASEKLRAELKAQKEAELKAQKEAELKKLEQEKLIQELISKALIEREAGYEKRVQEEVAKRLPEEVAKRMQALANTNTQKAVEVPAQKISTNNASDVKVSAHNDTARIDEEEQRLQEMLNGMTSVPVGSALTKK